METKEIIEECQNCAHHVQPLVGSSDTWPERCQSCMVWSDTTQTGAELNGHLELKNWEPAVWLDLTATLPVPTKPALTEEVGVKYDDDKPPMSLVPYAPVAFVAQVLAFGAKKYDAHNWRKGMAWSRLISAIERHIGKFKDGEDIDPESGLPHLAHAATGCLFLIQYWLDHPELDDRYKAS